MRPCRSCAQPLCSSQPDLETLPEFLNEFGQRHESCLVCARPLSTAPATGSSKALKEVCVRSVLPVPDPDLFLRPVRELGLELDGSYPFCEDCTEERVARLAELYQQLREVWARFEEVRKLLVQDVIQAYVRDQGGREEEPERLFECWKDRVSAEIPSGHWRRRRRQGNGGEEADADLSVPSSPEGFGDEGEGERVRVKDEPLDYSEMDFDQSELLPVLNWEEEGEDGESSIAPSTLCSKSRGRGRSGVKSTGNRPGPKSSKSLMDGQLPVIHVNKSKTARTRKGRGDGDGEVTMKRIAPTATTTTSRARKRASTATAAKPSRTQLRKKTVDPSGKGRPPLKRIKLEEEPASSQDVGASGQRRETIKRRQQQSGSEYSEQIPLFEADGDGTVGAESGEPMSSCMSDEEPYEFFGYGNAETESFPEDDSGLNDGQNSAANEDFAEDDEESDDDGFISIVPDCLKQMKQMKKKVATLKAQRVAEGNRNVKQSSTRKSKKCATNKNGASSQSVVKNTSSRKQSKPQFAAASFDVDFSSPGSVSEFSSMLTHDVTSLLECVDATPGGKRKSRTLASFRESPINSDQEEEGEGEEFDVNKETEAGSDVEQRPTKPNKRKPNRSGEVKIGRPKGKSTGTIPAGATRNEKTGRINIKSMCEVCGKVLCSKWNLRVHMRSHEEQKPFACDVDGCTKRFARREHMKTHRRTHTQERPYICDICNSRFSYRHVLRTHKANKHSIFDSEGVFQCVCGDKSISESYLRKHFRHCARKQPDKDFVDRYTVYCSYCNLNFEDGEEYKTHIANDPKHLEIKAKKIEEARKELSEFRARTIDPVHCPQCQEQFQDERLLAVHVHKFHTIAERSKVNPTCEFCGKSFSSYSSLKTHLILHSEDKPFCCDSCGQGFNTKASWQNHVAKEHEVPAFSCKFCGKGATTERLCRKHMAVHHKEVYLTKENPFYCKVCYLLWPTEEVLQEHTHSEHKDSVCPICGKAYWSKFEIKRHIRAMHPSEAERYGVCAEDSNDGEEQGSQKRHRGRPRKMDLEGKVELDSQHNANPNMSSGALVTTPPQFQPLPNLSFEQQYAVVSQMQLQQSSYMRHSTST